MFYLTKDGSGLPRDPFAAIVSPRPIAWISTRGATGAANLAPYSFFNAVAYTPPQFIVSSIGGKLDRTKGKDSSSHILVTGVFCINIAGFEDHDGLASLLWRALSLFPRPFVRTERGFGSRAMNA